MGMPDIDFTTDIKKQPLEVFFKKIGLKKSVKLSKENTCVGVFFNKAVDLKVTNNTA